MSFTGSDAQPRRGGLGEALEGCGRFTARQGRSRSHDPPRRGSGEVHVLPRTLRPVAFASAMWGECCERGARGVLFGLFLLLCPFLFRASSRPPALPRRRACRGHCGWTSEMRNFNLPLLLLAPLQQTALVAVLLFHGVQGRRRLISEHGLVRAVESLCPGRSRRSTPPARYLARWSRVRVRCCFHHPFDSTCFARMLSWCRLTNLLRMRVRNLLPCPGTC